MQSMQCLSIATIIAVLLSFPRISSSFRATTPLPSTQHSRHAQGTRAVPVRLSSHTAGQGGGIFYDGPQGKRQRRRLRRQRAQQEDEHSENNDGALTSSSSSTFPNEWRGRSSRTAVVPHKDCIIVGAGLAGLSAALYLSQLDPTRHICILEREEQSDAEQPNKKTTVASLAAAGMLAPQSERLPKGPLLDICVASRKLYPDFVDLVESLAAAATTNQDFSSVRNVMSDNSKQPWHGVGYVASGGFLAPAFAGDVVATWSPPEDSGSAIWLDATQAREMEPHLDASVVGAWWFPEDASVDARRLTRSLKAACIQAGVEIQSGADVTSLDLADGHCNGLWLANGKYLRAKQVLVANGAWMRNLLPVPIEPHKGQSISLRMPADSPPMLRRVLFAQDTYIVPKSDGRIVVGATVEAGSYDSNVTPAGLMHIMTHALQLVPGLADLPLEKTWVGLRPTTPDKGPILGKTPWDNLFLAGGYWRNGVLLAPKTGQLLAMLLSGHSMSRSDQALLDAFAWDRFTSPEKSAAVAADTRYAASMHPIHRRKSGAGVAAAVGTELGSYSTARSAAEERSQDRSALFGASGDDALERAAEMGRNDAIAFVYQDSDEGSSASTEVSHGGDVDQLSLPDEASVVRFPQLSNGSLIVQSKASHISRADQTVDTSTATSTKYEGSADAYTVSSQDDDDDDDDEKDAGLSSIYENIKQNKQAMMGDIEMGDAEPDTREDPGFRIHHVDPETGEEREVPPFTSPDDVVKSLVEQRNLGTHVNGAPPASAGMLDSGDLENQDDSIFDGYKAIEEANADVSREDSLKAMREARLKNRGESEPLNLDEDSFVSIRSEPSSSQSVDEDAIESEGAPDLSDIYKRIRENKAAVSSNVEMGDAPEDDRKDPGFRLYYIDPDTGDSHEVPPFTSPDAMVQMVKAKKTAAEATNGAKQDASAQVPLEEYTEQTFDGYQDIQQANSRTTREEELEAMRAARRQNRVDAEDIDESKIGVQRRSNT